MFIPHIDLMPLIYGIVIFLGLLSMWRKLVHLQLIAFTVEASVFWLVFALHGGSMTGGMSAAIAALLAGYFFPRLMRRRV